MCLGLSDCMRVYTQAHPAKILSLKGLKEENVFYVGEEENSLSIS
jgi:hypothetical protein